MNNFKRISAVILALCTAATIFTSCDSKNNDGTSTTAETIVITEFITEKETVEVEVTDEKGNVSVSVSEKIVTVPVTKTVTVTTPPKNDNSPEKDDNSPEKGSVDKSGNSAITRSDSATIQPVSAAATSKAGGTITEADTKATTKKVSVRTTVPTTKRPAVDDVVNEKSVGLFLLSKTDPVQTGNQATVFIQGTPGKTYSIDFYETLSSTAKIDDAKADANGFVSWSFEITDSCSPGKRKIIIKENDSANYIETSITVR